MSPTPEELRSAITEALNWYGLRDFCDSNELGDSEKANDAAIVLQAFLDEPTPEPRKCCERDHDSDGNCDRHPAEPERMLHKCDLSDRGYIHDLDREWESAMRHQEPAPKPRRKAK